MMYSVAPIYGLDEPIEYVELNYNGMDVLACKTSDGYVLERIYSTDPKDFLNENLQPGTLLENTLIK
nr:YlzJ-like family protein [uncultured Cellulosilyticum sp.]